VGSLHTAHGAQSSHNALKLTLPCPVGPQVILYKTLNLHLARPYPKRAAGTALLNAIGGTSNIWASYMYINPPHYYIAFGTLLAIDVVFAVVITVYKVWVGRENRKLDQGGDKAKETMKGGVLGTGAFRVHGAEADFPCMLAPVAKLITVHSVLTHVRALVRHSSTPFHATAATV
jgi:hypothetical protein